jgi:O-antigen ligase
MTVAAARSATLAHGAGRHRIDSRTLAPWIWWSFAAVLLAAAVYFHSNADPGTRFAVRMGGATKFGPTWFDAQKFGPFTPGDMMVACFGYLAVIHRVRSGLTVVTRRAVALVVPIAVVILLGVATGEFHNTGSPFGDWRDLAVGAIFAFSLWSTVLRTDEGCFRFAALFVAIITAYGTLQLFEYLRGGGEIAFYGRTPTANHATLEFMAAAVGVSLAMLRTRRMVGLWRLAIIVDTMVVVLAFRRYAWVELAGVLAVFVFLSGRNRRRYVLGILAIAAAGAVAIAISPSSLNFSERLASFNPSDTKSTNALAATNQDHINDILDGVDQIRAHPVTGLGVGVLYVGRRTARWKGDVGMVHNGPVEIWIKFGVIGVITYIGVYLFTLREIFRRRRGQRYVDIAAFGAGSFMFGNFLITCTVYPWPFGVWEDAILMFSLVAMAFAPGWRGASAPPPRRRAAS